MHRNVRASDSIVIQFHILIAFFFALKKQSCSFYRYLTRDIPHDVSGR